uniref:GGDEF domain-containing protein n=1 Tax=Oscillibacter ruminantium TaxID=1263547 RepID=UPI0033345F81
LGGDEFFVLMQGVQGKTNVETKAKEICRAVVKVCSANGSECRVSTSIGIALSPEHGNNFTQLYAHADAALYHVKSNGRNGYMIYSGEYAAQNAAENLLLDMD